MDCLLSLCLSGKLFLACVFCVGMVIAESNEKILKIPRLDLWIALAVWLATVALWLGQPIVPNSSALEPRAPNFEVYPFSDAQTYDEFSQSVLIGNGFGANEIPQRPLYIVFLAFLHVLVGQDYGKVIALQSMVFALFPVLLYLFGREFFGRPIGISIALLAILRDYTSNLVSPFTGNLSYSKALSFRDTHCHVVDPVFADRHPLDQIGFSCFFRISHGRDFGGRHVNPHPGGGGISHASFVCLFCPAQKINSDHKRRVAGVD